MRRSEYYHILEVDRSATKPEIKKAFRRKAKTLHPDTNPSIDAQDNFVLLTEAYDALYHNRFPKRALMLRPKPKYTPEEIRRNLRDRYEHPKTDADRRKHLEKARQRLAKRKAMAERAFMIYYHRHLRSFTYRTTQALSVLSLFFALLLGIEMLMPYDVAETFLGKTEVYTQVASITAETNPNSIVHKLKLGDGPSVQVNREMFNAVKIGQRAELKTSAIFSDLAEIVVTTPKGYLVYQPRNSLAELWPILLIGLIIPILTFTLKAPNVFYFKVLAFNRVISVIFLSWLLLGNNRLLTLVQVTFS